MPEKLQNGLIALVVAGTVGFVGLQIMSTVIGSLNITGNNSDPNVTNDPLYNATQDLQTAVNDAWSLVGVLFLVVILAIIVFYLRQTR
jgi:hypothetical protein